MAYSKQTWVRGEKVASVKLNHMEDGIAAISANGAIDTSNLANAAVTNDKLDQEAVDSNNIRTGAILTPLIYDGAVTLAKLADAVKSHFATADDVSELKSEITNMYESGHYQMTDAQASNTVASRGISNSGAVAYDAAKTTSLYKVSAGDLIYLELNANSGTTSAVWEFTTKSTVGSLSADGLVGSVHFEAIDDIVTVPTGALYIAVSQSTSDTTFKVQRVTPKDFQKEIDNIAYGAYENIIGTFTIGSILNGADSSGTTRIRHTKPVVYDRDIFVFVRSGFKYYIAFYADAQGTQYLYTREFVTNDLPICIGANQYFRMVVCKTTEETVTDIDTYVNALYVSTQLFNNPQVYRNTLVKQIAHQGYNPNPRDGVGHSLLSAYACAGVAGFTHGETDIQFSSDGVAVCCHDATFTDLDSETTITINNKTYEELQTYNYYGGKIASFDDVVKACKTAGLGLYIDHLDISFTQAEWQSLFASVQRYGMERNVVWLITSKQQADIVSAWDANANFSFVVASASSFDYALATCEAIKTATNTVSIDIYISAFPVSTIGTYLAQLPVGITLEAWCVDTITDWNAYLPYVTGITSNRVCANIVRQLG